MRSAPQQTLDHTVEVYQLTETLTISANKFCCLIFVDAVRIFS